MPKLVRCTVELTISSAVGLQAFREAAEAIMRIIEDQPWNEDAKEARDKLSRAAEALVAGDLRKTKSD